MKEKDAQLFRVAAGQVNLTIAAALRQWLPGKSWSDVRRLLSSRHVTVSGNLCLDEGRRLKEEEVVKLLAHPAAAPPKEEDVRIRFLDAHLVVVEKPAGMTTLRHPEERNWPRRRKQLQPTLDEMLPRVIEKKERGAKRHPKPARGGKQQPKNRPEFRQEPRKGPPKRLRAVHRIDRETSGLMIFARTVDAERILGTQFRAHSLHRVYIAVALGDVREQTFESSLVPDRGDGRRGSTSNRKLGKRAVTHVKPVERLNGYTVVECRLETGRTHQIRIHLSEAGHPLCGDKVYRGPFPGKPTPDESGAPRLALHAAELGFDHPITGEPLKFVMPLPPDMTRLIDRLRGRS
jgi:23S rRNA pseudouridine1911/1915/1917 synthase